MKKIILPSLIVITAILLFFATKAMSQRTDTKVKAFNESIAEEKSGSYSKALERLMSVYEENKNNYLVNLRLGWLYYMEKKYDTSKSHYQKAIALSSKSVEAYLGLTLPLSALNDWAGVQDAYRGVLKVDPSNYTANLRMGQILLNSKDYQGAKNHLEKVYSLYPGEYEPNLSLGWTYYYLGNNKKASELFTSALMLNAGDSLATQGLALVK